MNVARRLLLAAIRGYKRHLSPRKGFACAYRVHEGCASCSTLGLRAISRYGAWRGLGVLRLRLEQCRLAAQAHRERRRMPAFAQAGFIDCAVPCDASCVDASACSFGDACTLCDACEIASCLDCGGTDDYGWPWRSKTATVRRRRRRGEPVAWEPGPGAPADEPPPEP
jgi:putative component of membrane protein insertase Oxa1/YidC/SpoIIIJ protein YidD